MENKAYVDGEQPPPYDPKVEPQPPAYPQPQPQAYPQPQPQGYPQPQPQPQPYSGYGGGYQGQPPAAGQPTVVMIAPESQVMNAGSQVQDNMVISIISIFFCCILGIVATIKASDSKEALKRGDIALAEQKSVSARKLALAAIIIGCVCGAISILSSIVSASAV